MAGTVQSVQAVQATIASVGELLNQQAVNAGKATKLAGQGRTLGDYMKDAKGDAGKQAPVHEINNGMTSLQLIVDPKRSTVTVQRKGGNTLVEQIDGVQRSAEFKELTKNRETRDYYRYLQAPIFEATKRMSLYSQAVFTARAGKSKDIESAARKQLTKAVTSLVKAKKYAGDPERAKILATQAGILKGLIEATSVQSVVKTYPTLDKELQPFFAKLGVEDVYQQAADAIIKEAKQDEKPAENPVAGRMPGGMPPFQMPGRAAA